MAGKTTTESTKPKRKLSPGLKPPWKKGQSGNPTGLPKGYVQIATLLRRRLVEASTLPNREKKKVADDIADRMIELALDGHPKFAAMLLDRADGPVTQKVEHSVEESTLKIVKGVDEEKL